MQTKVQNLGRVYRPAPGTTEYRREVHWKELSNEDLKRALDLLELHQSPFVGQALEEIERRIEAGKWLDIYKSPPLSGYVPLIFKIWPFSLFWKQGRQAGE